MAHSHHMHREHQVSHRRVHHILKHEPEGAKHHSHSHAFSKVTSKTAAEKHDDYACGGTAPKRYARGGKVKSKSGHQTNIAIVVPHKGAQQPMAGAPPGGAMPMPAPGGPPPGMPPGAGGPGMMPPPGGPPMRARGGKIGGYIEGEADEKNIKKWSKRASDNSYFRGGAASGVGREEKAEHEKHKKHK